MGPDATKTRQKFGCFLCLDATCTHVIDQDSAIRKGARALRDASVFKPSLSLCVQQLPGGAPQHEASQAAQTLAEVAASHADLPQVLHAGGLSIQVSHRSQSVSKQNFSKFARLCCAWCKE